MIIRDIVDWMDSETDRLDALLLETLLGGNSCSLWFKS